MPLNTYLNVLAYIINITITFLIGHGIPGTQSNDILSAKYQTLITPVGWAFSIWAIIFTSQFIFCVAQILPNFRDHPLVQRGVGYNYVGACLAQAGWGLVFGFELIELSVVFMLLILFFLVRIVMDQSKVQQENTHGLRDFWLLDFPFRIHCGWIVAASLVNVNLVLVKLKESASAQFSLALASLVVALVVALLRLFGSTRTHYVIPCVLVWATVSSTLSASSLTIALTHSNYYTAGYSCRARGSKRFNTKDF